MLDVRVEAAMVWALWFGAAVAIIALRTLLGEEDN
jgi:hypothetical protein